MKVLLVKPYNKQAYSLVPPVGLGYLATSLRNNGHEASIIDCTLNKVNYNSFRNYINSFKPDAVAFQVFSSDLPVVQEYINIIKKIDKNIITIAGGPHVSAVPYDSIKFFKGLDYGFVGEAELGVVKLLECIKNKKELSLVPGLVYKDNDKITVNPSYFERDLDKLGFPAWDLLDPRKYPETPQGGFAKAFPIALIQSTRGCPYNCTFCSGAKVNGKMLRYRSVEHVIKELKMLKEKYGVKEFHMIDDNFTLNKDYVTKFCNALLREKLNLFWATPNGIRLDTLDRNVLKLMKKAGCYAVSVGIESGSDRVLKLMKKHLDTKNIREKIGLIHEVGLRVTGLFILGYPDETVKEIKKTAKFARKLKIDRAQFGCFLPLPGTEIYYELVRRKEIKKIKNWEEYASFANVVYAPKGLTKEKLKKLQRNAILRFYLRPAILFKILRDVTSFRHFRFLIKRLLAYAR